MENYHLVSQWAAKMTADKALKEIQDFKDRYTWAILAESNFFIKQMSEDLPKILNIIKLQEKNNSILRYENEKLRGYIKANQMADECIINDIAKKFNIDL